jgi:hypothetical protein
MLKGKMINNEHYKQLTQNYIQEQIFIAIVIGISNAMRMCNYRKEISQLGTADDFEGNNGGIIDILSRYVPGRTEKHHGKLSHDCHCLGRCLKLSTPKYISEGLQREVKKKKKCFLQNNILLLDKQRN